MGCGGSVQLHPDLDVSTDASHSRAGRPEQAGQRTRRVSVSPIRRNSSQRQGRTESRRSEDKEETAGRNMSPSRLVRQTLRGFSPTRLMLSSGPLRRPRGTAPWPPAVVPERLPCLSQEAVRLAVAARLQALDLPTGETLFSEGDRGSSVFFMTSGTVSVMVADSEVARLGARCYFGELGLMLNDRRAASIVAAEPCTIMELTRDDFYSVSKSAQPPRSLRQH